ncbi:hypothetical protein [Hippea alviniae]|uniref:hypothetical protein n=1 Tax=Hippea alviniae TaxID=1279027 RepID=UPI0003B405F8|nr:hypothetical protein [Hippea alviniae]
MDEDPVSLKKEIEKGNKKESSFDKVSYLIGLYKLFSWNNLSEDFLNIFNSIFELTENNMEERELPKQQHSLFERLYNKITGSLIAEKIKKNGVRVEFFHNFTIKVPGLFFNKNSIEVDIAFWNKENCKIVFIETTAHKKEEDEWKNHFTKKSAISNILFQQARDKGWSVRYIYFYSFGFSSAERAFGVENFSENGTHFIFLPMWNFKQYKFLLNFNDKNWMNYQKQKNESSLHDNIENELENTLNKLVNAVSSFLENG